MHSLSEPERHRARRNGGLFGLLPGSRGRLGRLLGLLAHRRVAQRRAEASLGARLLGGLCPRLGLRVGGPDELDEVGLRSSGVNLYEWYTGSWPFMMRSWRRPKNSWISCGSLEGVYMAIASHSPGESGPSSGWLMKTSSSAIFSDARAAGESEALMARDEALKPTKKGLL
mgnify:CR=1 FL=1